MASRSSCPEGFQPAAANSCRARRRVSRGDAATVGLGDLHRLAEQARRQLLAIGREQQPFGTPRLANGGKFAVRVVTLGPGIGGVEQGAIGPFEVEHQPQGLAHPAVGERRPATVEEQRLGLGRDLVGDFGADHLAAGYRGETVAIGPVFRLLLDIEVEFAGLERLEGDVAVAIELHLDPVKVVLAAIDR